MKSVVHTGEGMPRRVCHFKQDQQTSWRPARLARAFVYRSNQRMTAVFCVMLTDITKLMYSLCYLRGSYGVAEYTARDVKVPRAGRSDFFFMVGKQFTDPPCSVTEFVLC